MRKKHHLWGFLVMVISALLLAGCGSSSGTFTAPAASTNAGTGSVTFNFARAQTALTVPADTQEIRFDFFSGPNGTGTVVLSTTRPFATQITIENVPTTTQSVVVTALGPNGTGLGGDVTDIVVVDGQDTVAEFEVTPDPTPTPPPPAPTVQLNQPTVLSSNQSASKAKLILLQINNGGVFQDVLISVYADTAGPDVYNIKGDTFAAQDLFARRSTDGGQTWSAPVNLSNTANSSSIMVDDDGDDMSPPVAFFGHSQKPNIFGTGKNIQVSWVDAYVPGGNQSSARYPEVGNIEVPFSATYTIRSNDGGLTWSAPQRLGDGSRDAKQDVNRGNSAAWCVMWQEDPKGLRSGDAEGPGEGGSGATVNHGTDIWFTSLAAADFGSGTPFPPAVRLTDNFTKFDKDGLESGQVGAARANIALFGGTAVVAYEETKGLEGLDVGKYIRYHVFPALNPAADPTAGVGTIISTASESGRRVRILPQSTPGPATGLRMCLLWREGDFDDGGPADIVTRLGHLDPNNASSTGLRPEDLSPAVAAGATDRANALNNAAPVNLSSDLGLAAGTSDNPFEDARAHRGIIRGDTVFMGYSHTPDWAISKYTTGANYNFFLRRTTDGGATWSAPHNISNITDTTINVKEPRIVGTPKSSNPDAPQNPNVVYIGWGTEENVFEHLLVPAAPLDILLTFTTDLGATFGGVTTLAGGPAEQFESQIRTSPGGETFWAVWMDKLNGVTNAVFNSGTLP
jgi:hypothetical protein